MYKRKKFDLGLQILENIKIGNNNLKIHIIDKKSKIDLIWLHGSAVNKEKHIQFIHKLTNAVDFNIIIPFYRGFGLSEGSPSEIKILTDITILKRVLDKRKTDKFIFGQSLGCATSLYLNKLIEAKGLILENPFYSLQDVIKNLWKYKYFGFLLTQRWENFKRIGFAKKILFLVSENDKLVMPENTNKLIFYCKNYKKIIIKGANHMNAFEKDSNFFRYIKDFITNSYA